MEWSGDNPRSLRSLCSSQLERWKRFVGWDVVYGVVRGEGRGGGEMGDGRHLEIKGIFVVSIGQESGLEAWFLVC